MASTRDRENKVNLPSQMDSEGVGGGRRLTFSGDKVTSPPARDQNKKGYAMIELIRKVIRSRVWGPEVIHSAPVITIQDIAIAREAAAEVELIRQRSLFESRRDIDFNCVLCGEKVRFDPDGNLISFCEFLDTYNLKHRDCKH